MVEILVDTKPQIAILLPDLRGGGAERVSIDLARELQHQGYLVEFVLMQGVGEFLAEAQECFTVTGLNVARLRNLPLKLAKYLKDRKPTALIANMWPLTIVVAMARLTSRTDCRLLVVEHCDLASQYHSSGAWHHLIMRLTMAVGYRWANCVAGVSTGFGLDPIFRSTEIYYLKTLERKIEWQRSQHTPRSSRSELFRSVKAAS